jgi:hypothetical protein
MVEMAMVLPVLTLLTFGLIEYGWTFVQLSRFNSTASHGARLAMTPDATVNQVRQTVNKLMQQAGIKPEHYTLSVTGIDRSEGEPVEVRITVPYERISATGITMLPAPEQLVCRATMPKTGP